jgi:CheY-specific phosphatase CheX
MIDGDPQAGHAAVLHISTPGLREVTATMFDMAADRLDERQLDDVGRELCNILGACCVEALRHEGETLTIGLPQSLSAHGLVDLLSRGSVLVQFVAVNIEGSPTVRVLRFQ